MERGRERLRHFCLPLPRIGYHLERWRFAAQAEGHFAVARAQEETLPLCRALDYRSGAEFSAQFSHTQVCLTARSKTLVGETLIQVHPRLPCEHRRYTVKTWGKRRRMYPF